MLWLLLQAPSIRWFLDFSDLLLVTPLCFLAPVTAVVFFAGVQHARGGGYSALNTFPFLSVVINHKSLHSPAQGLLREHPVAWGGGTGDPALWDPAAGAGCAAAPRGAAGGCPRRMLPLAPGPRSAPALDADSRCCMSKTCSTGHARCRLRSRYLAQQSAASPCPAPPRCVHPRTPKSWSPCPRGAGTPQHGAPQPCIISSSALGSTVPWFGGQGAVHPGQSRGLGWYHEL